MFVCVCVSGGGGYNSYHIEYGLVVMMKVIVMAMLHSVIVCEVGYNANHIEDEGSEIYVDDRDGYVSAGLRGFTLSLCVGVAGVVRGA